MGKILFANIGWMTHYEGITPDDMIVGGGSYQDKDKHEAFNFLPVNGYCYGYVEPPAQSKRIALERIDRNCYKDSLNNVLVIWTACRPKGKGGTYIVGWYKNATIYRYAQPSNSTKRNRYNYFIRAKKEDCTILKEDARNKEIPRRKKGFLGRTNIWYADSPKKEVQKFITEVLDYVNNPTITSPKRNVKGINTKARKAVEDAAIKYVKNTHEEIGYNVYSVEKENLGWDLVAINGKIELHIEVKGLADSEISVHITPNEYSKMNNEKGNKHYRLCVVTNALKTPTLSTFLLDGKQWVCEEDSSLTLSFDESIAAIAYVK